MTKTDLITNWPVVHGFVFLLALLFTFDSYCICAEQGPVYNVRNYGARGDGSTLDTQALNNAIDACSSAGGGQVLVPVGKYVTGTVHLKSNVTFQLDAGAELVGTTDLNQYESFTPPDGCMLPTIANWHRALVLANGAENIAITGQGVINGSNVVDAEGEEGVRGPHAVLFGNCKNVRLRDISVHNAGNYAILLEFTSDVEIRGIKVLGGYDGVHFRGWINNPCRNVTISDCEFYTGDDCIAGWHWQDTLVDRCVLNSASNGIRLFGPAKHVIVHDCLFFGPGRYAWRTMGLNSRKNMTSGLCIQPSAWGATEGTVDDVQVSDVVMRDVGTPLHLAAVSPSTIGRITIDRLTATGIYRAAASIESWVAEPIARVDIRDSSLNFVGGFGPVWSDPAEAAMSYLTKESGKVEPPGVNPRPLPAWGMYARPVASLNLSDVRIEVDNDDDRPAIIMNDVESLMLDNFTIPTVHR